MLLAARSTPFGRVVMFLLSALHAESLAITDISEIRPLPRPSFLMFFDHFSCIFARIEGGDGGDTF